MVLLFFRHIGEVLLDGLLFLKAIVFILHRHVTNKIDLLGMFAQNGIEVANRIAAQHDVGTTTRHVGGNGDGAAATRLRDNLRLTFVVLRV